MKYPFELHENQVKYVDDVNKFFDSSHKYQLHEAPTGFGKTLVNLITAINWIDNIAEMNKRLDEDKEPIKSAVIYFAREHKQIEQCSNELKNLIALNGYEHVRAVHIAGKKYTCIRKEVYELPTEEDRTEACDVTKHLICDYSNDFKKINKIKNKDHVYTLNDKSKKMYYNFTINSGSKFVKKLNIENIIVEHVDDIVEDLFVDSIADNKKILDVAEKYTICPRKIQTLALQHANIVFAPYNYMTLPTLITKLSNSYVIVDEAHNLDQNIANMYKQSTNYNYLLNYITNLVAINYQLTPKYKIASEKMNIIKKVHKEITNVLIKIERSKKSYISGNSLEDLLQYIKVSDVEDFCGIIGQFISNIRKFNVTNKRDNIKINKNLLSVNSFFNQFVLLIENSKNGLLEITRKNNNIYVSMQLVNVDYLFKRIFYSSNKVLISSGTLYPKFMRVYLRLKDSVMYSYPPQHLNLKGTGHVITSYNGVKLNTTWKSRNDPKVYQAYAKIISDIHKKNPKGTLCFFPSYSYMSKVGMILKNRHGVSYQLPDTIDTYRNRINNGKKALFMTAFKGLGNEGWNFPDDESRAIILCGTPFLPIKDPMVETQMKYYRKFGKIWYQQKAVLWLLQAYGRGFRHKNDYTQVYFVNDGLTKLKPQFLDWVKTSINWTPKRWETFKLK